MRRSPSLPGSVRAGRSLHAASRRHAGEPAISGATERLGPDRSRPEPRFDRDEEEMVDGRYTELPAREVDRVHGRLPPSGAGVGSDRTAVCDLREDSDPRGPDRSPTLLGLVYYLMLAAG